MGYAGDGLYQARSQEDIVRLVRTCPFGWLISAGGHDAAFTPLPVRAELDAAGRLVAVCGHLARRNPHVPRLRRDARAQVLIIGPHGYVSPGWLDDRTQAPTWNYAAVVFELMVSVHEGADEVRAELDALVTQMEAGRPRAWSVQEMGGRHVHLAAQVIAWRGEVRGMRATFKLGQDETRENFMQLLCALDAQGNITLTDWMRDFQTVPGVCG